MAKELRLVLVLTVICVVSAAVLGLVNALTAPAIKAQNEMAQQKALQEALPAASQFRAETSFQAEESTGVVGVYRGYQGSQLEGLVFIVEQRGYADVIRLAVGVTKDGNLAGLTVISQAETPGLGAKITGEKFRAQKAFRDATNQDQLAVTKDKGQVEAITSATVSSRAVVRGVNAALAISRSLLAGEAQIGGAAK
ncbi:MAG TPA: RnfABCDGE type electron transport complex subunit G [Firmicutes bacterium]|jgi:electron transport complex protein RnfG|nr:RnfABCDGE type electron transport complex subunit G [Bacillota bacterium]